MSSVKNRATPKWYPWSPAVYRSDRVLALSLAEHGAYRNLIDAAFERGGFLPIDPENKILWRLALAQSPEEFSAVREVVLTFFHEQDGKLTNERVQTEYREACRGREKKSAAGKKGAKVLWSKMLPREQRHSDAIATPEQRHADKIRLDKKREEDQKEPLSSQLDCDPTGVPALNAVVAKLFAHFIAATDRNPKLYSLTQKRQDWGRARLRQCLKKADGDMDKAERLLRMCADKLAASDWHMGRDEKTADKKYNGWEQIYRSPERVEFWLER